MPPRRTPCRWVAQGPAQRPGRSPSVSLQLHLRGCPLGNPRILTEIESKFRKQSKPAPSLAVPDEWQLEGRVGPDAHGVQCDVVVTCGGDLHGFSERDEAETPELVTSVIQVQYEPCKSSGILYRFLGDGFLLVWEASADSKRGHLLAQNLLLARGPVAPHSEQAMACIGGSQSGATLLGRSKAQTGTALVASRRDGAATLSRYWQLTS